MLSTIIFLLVMGVLVWALIMIFNRFVRNKNLVQDAWSNISVALKKRYDLIPNLINTVKGYAAHEKDTLNQVIQARNTALEVPGTNINGQIEAEKNFSMALRQLFALSEAYPDLKANTVFLDLQQNLKEQEDLLEKSRRYYNGTVRENNIYGQSFPGVLFAGIFGYKHFDFFEIPETEKQSVTVQF